MGSEFEDFEDFEDEEPLDMDDINAAGMINPDEIDDDIKQSNLIAPEAIKTTNKQQKEMSGDEFKKLELNLFKLSKMNLADVKSKIEELSKKMNSSKVEIKNEDVSEKPTLNIRHDKNKNIVVIDEETIIYINESIEDLMKNSDFLFIDELNTIINKIEKMLENNEKIIDNKNKTEILNFQKEIKGLELLLKDVEEIKSDTRKSLGILSVPKKIEADVVYENENNSSFKEIMITLLIVGILMISSFIGLQQTVKINGSVSFFGLNIQEDYSHNNFIKR